MRRLAVAWISLMVFFGALWPQPTVDESRYLPQALLHPYPAVPDIPGGVTSPEDRRSPAADAGGAAVTHLAGGRPLGTSSASARLFRTGFGAGEPTLGVTSDGSIFFQALDGPPKVVRTKDGGRTWKDVSPKIAGRQRHPLTLDPYLYVDPRTDRVFTYDFYFGCSEISFSDDRGKTWTTTVLNCGLMDHQNLFAGPPVVSPTVGYPNVVYTCSTQFGVTIYSVAAQCLKSLDGGITWLPTGTLPYRTQMEEENDLGLEGYCHGAVGHGFVGDDGTVYLPKGLCGQPWLAISRDEGATWERVQVADNGMPQTEIGVYEHETAVAADAKGNVYYFWVAGDRMPYLAISRDGGKRWSEPMMIGPPGIKESTLPKIDVGAPGKVAIAYYGSTNSPGRPFPQTDDCKPDPVSCFRELFFLGPPDPPRYKDVTWNGYMTVSEDVVDRNPTFHTASVNDPRDPFVRGTCGPIRCKSVYDFIDVVVDRAGQPWAAYVDICIQVCATKGPSNVGDEGVLGTIVNAPKLR
ncbi:MAG: glycoside hydrolase [Actinomycetota bacterium]|nr:glycoside hydrolase [Actinomycetota bacterium]